MATINALTLAVIAGTTTPEAAAAEILQNQAGYNLEYARVDGWNWGTDLLAADRALAAIRAAYQQIAPAPRPAQAPRVTERPRFTCPRCGEHRDTTIPGRCDDCDN